MSEVPLESRKEFCLPDCSKAALPVQPRSRPIRMTAHTILAVAEIQALLFPSPNMDQGPAKGVGNHVI